MWHSCPANSARRLKSAVDQSRTRPSLPHEARVLPSGLTASALTHPVWASKVRRGDGFSPSIGHTSTLPAQSPEKSVLLAGSKASARTQLLWPAKAVRLPVAISQRWTLLSWAPAKTKRPDGSKRQPISGLLYFSSLTSFVFAGSTFPFGGCAAGV